MRTLKLYSMAAAFAGASLISGLAAAQDPSPAVPPEAAPPANVPAPSPGPTATPADTGAAAPATAAAAAPTKSINVDVEMASAYLWRGLNLFGANHDSQDFSVFPSITGTFGGFTIGYWGAFQLTGDNKGDLVDKGVGAETDIILGYGGAITDKLSYSAHLTYWIYPAAKESVAQTKTPMFLEPALAAVYSTVADLGLSLSYYRGLQDVTRAASFVYINPSVGKTLPLTNDLSLALGLVGGYKAYTNLPAGTPADGKVDLTFNGGVTIPFSDMYITPGVHAAFLTRADGVIPGGAGFKDEFIAWAGVHVGYNVGL
jgi:hypothetical protein